VVSALHALTLDECVALVPRARRRAAAAAAVRRADRLDGASSRHARTSAALRGASSATHTHALLAGAASRESQALRAFADALLIEAESEVAL
jgi:hypothetical protein